MRPLSSYSGQWPKGESGNSSEPPQFYCCNAKILRNVGYVTQKCSVTEINRQGLCAEMGTLAMCSFHTLLLIRIELSNTQLMRLAPYPLPSVNVQKLAAPSTYLARVQRMSFCILDPFINMRVATGYQDP